MPRPFEHPEKRYYYDNAAEQDDPVQPYGEMDTARIIDTEAGGPIAYCHEANADYLVDTLNAGEEAQ